jgi:hypothetical protein
MIAISVNKSSVLYIFSDFHLTVLILLIFVGFVDIKTAAFSRFDKSSHPHQV